MWRSFSSFLFVKKKNLLQKREVISPMMIRTHFSQGIIKISLLILFTVSHTVLVMMVWKI